MIVVVNNMLLNMVNLIVFWLVVLVFDVVIRGMMFNRKDSVVIIIVWNFKWVVLIVVLWIDLLLYCCFIVNLMIRIVFFVFKLISMIMFIWV